MPMPKPALLVILAFAYPWKAGFFFLSVICSMLHDNNLGQRSIGFFVDFHLATVLDPPPSQGRLSARLNIMCLHLVYGPFRLLV